VVRLEKNLASVLNQLNYFIKQMALTKITSEETFKFEAVTKYEISKEDLIDLLITAGQGIYYWGEIYVNFRPNKAYKKGFLQLEREGGIIINKNNFHYDSEIFCLDYQCFEVETPDIIATKSIRDFVDTIKLIIETPNIKGSLRNSLVDAIASKDFGILDASNMDYIMQKCIFGSCVYG